MVSLINIIQSVGKIQVGTINECYICGKDLQCTYDSKTNDVFFQSSSLENRLQMPIGSADKLDCRMLVFNLRLLHTSGGNSLMMMFSRNCSLTSFYNNV